MTPDYAKPYRDGYYDCLAQCRVQILHLQKLKSNLHWWQFRYHRDIEAKINILLIIESSAKQIIKDVLPVDLPPYVAA